MTNKYYNSLQQVWVSSENETFEAEIRGKLKSALQMPNIMVLAGSGTSLGNVVKGPRMWDLWLACTTNDMEIIAKECFAENNFDITNESNRNIEICLSHCEAYSQVSTTKEKTTIFIKKCKELILEKCRFIKDKDAQLLGHKEFIRKLARRKSKDPRVKLFTTNYDTCFEDAAGLLGITVIDGFSFSMPRIYDARFFDMDIVRRNSSSSSTNTHYLEGVYQLYKLHGSTNWSRRSTNSYIIEQAENVTAENSCMIFPAKGKYQQSYIQPHLELIARFSQSLRESNTCLIIAGFGFNDDHLSEPILSAILSNPHLKVIIVSPTIESDIEEPSSETSKYWGMFKKIADDRKNDEVFFLNCDFQQFSSLIPDLTALSPAENLHENMKKLFGDRDA
ncbi:SIR2 family protein [Acinetobacter baumannii]|uniref:SIR2 family protein n=2 Tax=Acinetobacter baumannii TaxID=470 RepID=UPI000CE56655|nr:SIR2 family protein [Acinetobacter baumannii]MCB2302199.1 SIR2 family protein [Acinetobacter baumannii]MCT9356011.1 SIR2 family protein [Acinetobacter baumannii]PPC19940.1 SIR2 family protein [Acinetobacter baumannii]UMN47332.1 SIR2 family protein [Acinetobacter baumannii]